MVLVHGGDGKGADRLAASWAERRQVPQIAFGLDARLGQRAGFKRNEQMLSLQPRYVVAFPGNGVLERLVIEAKSSGRNGHRSQNVACANSAFASTSSPVSATENELR